MNLDTSKISFSKQYESSLYMDEIQYTYKPCKLVLILSIHETERYILETQNGSIETKDY